jgi:hypothetical protein
VEGRSVPVVCGGSRAWLLRLATTMTEDKPETESQATSVTLRVPARILTQACLSLFFLFLAGKSSRLSCLKN